MSNAGLEPPVLSGAFDLLQPVRVVDHGGLAALLTAELAAVGSDGLLLGLPGSTDVEDQRRLLAYGTDLEQRLALPRSGW